MGVVQRVVKPKNQRSKRALEEREPKAIENTKTALMVKGPNSSQLVQDCMKDLYIMKKPHSVAYNQKNDIRPFEDATKLEFYAKKNDSSLFVFGSHNKKRPHNMILGRMFDYHLLDMVELGLESFTPLKQFKTAKVAAGCKPALLFHGDPFSDPANAEMQRLKNLLIDFFRGPEVTNIRLAGVEHLIQVTAVGPRVLLRSYKIHLGKSASRLPRVELEEIGPSIDWRLRRSQLASEDLYKEACRQLANVRKQKKVKNISEDVFGTKHAKIHIDAQQIKTIQTRKIKGLKETKEERVAEAEKKKEKAESVRQAAIERVFAEGED